MVNMRRDLTNPADCREITLAPFEDWGNGQFTIFGRQVQAWVLGGYLAWKIRREGGCVQVINYQSWLFGFIFNERAWLFVGNTS